MQFRICVWLMAFVGVCNFCAAREELSPEKAAKLPPPAGRTVSFARDVVPILAHNCFECHANGKRKGGFDLSSRETLMKGGDAGVAIVAGKSAQSDFIVRVAGLTGSDDENMPPTGKPLSAEEVSILRAWIDQGVAFETIAALKARKPVILPREVAVPAGDGNPIDRLLASYLKEKKVDGVAVVDDRTFARRVYLDVIGLPPTPEQLAAFLSDSRPDKRDQLVNALLSDNAGYADHWMSFWQDHLRDGKKSTDVSHKLKPITEWLHASLVANMPYNIFVSHLVNPGSSALKPEKEVVNENQPVETEIEKDKKEAAEPEKKEAEKKPDAAKPKDGEKPKEADKAKKDAKAKPKGPPDASGFIAGVQMGLGTLPPSQSREIQAAQNIGQVFLGVQLKCSTCHDSFVDRWSMVETWGLASVYAEKPLGMVRCEVATGKTAPPRFVFPEVGEIEPGLAKPERMKRLAELVTSPKNGRFSRTIVNRLWARLMGRGLVEPLDEMENAAWNADLLDWLANDLVENKYDLKKTIARILTSRAYQMPSVDTPRSAEFVFRGPQVRRMTAEQFCDAVTVLKGATSRTWKQQNNSLMDVLGRPDRSIVTTARSSKASTLQALELMNGADLFAAIYPTPKKPAAADKGKGGGAKEGAKKEAVPKKETPASVDPRELTEKLFQRSLGRLPNPQEVTVAKDVLGATPTPESIADLTWILIMLPEFQLIH